MNKHKEDMHDDDSYPRWSEEKPTCPLCGDWLSVERFLAKGTGEIIIEFTCLGAGSDEFDFLILTGVTNKDLRNLKEEGKIIQKDMKIQLLIRKPYP